MKQLNLLHKSGTVLRMPVESAEVRHGLPGGFDLKYVSDEVTVQFLRSEHFDAVWISEVTGE